MIRVGKGQMEKQTMISINGIGWINKRGFGSVMKDTRMVYDGGTLPKNKIFSAPFKNFGRLDNLSKLTCSAIALALRDAGMDCPDDRKHNIGIISTGSSGSFRTDMLYFKDYLESGRTLSRGNLFIYTLPSSPAGEAAIHFGLQGPLFYIASQERPAVKAFAAASAAISSGQASGMLTGISEEDHAVYFFLKGSGSSSSSLCGTGRVLEILKRDVPFDQLIKEVSCLKKGNTI